MAKNLRTPLIKPRLQGGSFYTFGSTIEDIGLNINNRSNRVELTHYALINIPAFSLNDLFFDENTPSRHYDVENAGDMYFADSFQNYALNFETVVRNQDGYNFAINKTCSEKIFWKWLSKISNMTFTQENGYYSEPSASSIVKGFGQILAGAQRSNDNGIYNETYVQIPSSYGPMKCYFKEDPDENFNITKGEFSCDNTIENIKDTEINNGYIKSTGLCASSICDEYNKYKIDRESTLSLVLDINKLREIKGRDDITYDDLGFGTYDNNNSTSYEFNAILVYYSIFDANSNEILATNLYGIYIINKAEYINGVYKFPTLTKKKTTQYETGTSFAFRLSIKTSSAYNGDIEIIDNSTASYGLSEDFNDVLKNLNVAIRSLTDNTKTMYELSQNNKVIRQLSAQALEKVNDLETTINNIKNKTDQNEKISLRTDPVLEDAQQISKDTAKLVLGALSTEFDFRKGNASLTINNNETAMQRLPENVQNICNNLYTEIDGKMYIDVLKILTILIAANK